MGILQNDTRSPRTTACISSCAVLRLPQVTDAGDWTEGGKTGIHVRNCLFARAQIHVAFVSTGLFGSATSCLAASQGSSAMVSRAVLENGQAPDWL